MQWDLRERRKCNRHNFNSSLEFKLTSGGANDAFMGYTINVSATGMCIGLYRRLSKGEQVSIQRFFLPFLVGNAKVCWIKEIEQGLYIAGLQVT